MLKTVSIVSLILAVAMLAGCSAINENGSNIKLGIMDVKAAELPAGIPEPSLIKSNNAFGLLLLQQMGNDWTGAYSPVSLAMALQLTMYGANDTARAAMEKTLKTTLSQSDIDISNGRLLSVWNNSKGVSVVNSVFANKDCEIKEDFAKSAADYYHAAVGSLDFADKENTLKTVNDWVSDNTSGRIKELLKDLNPDAQMILLNALDMDLKWQNKFKSHSTLESDFFGLLGTSKIELMSSDGSFRYLEVGGGQILTLPYEGNEYFMAVYLPKEGQSPQDYLINTEFTFEELEERPGTLYLPKADIETKFSAVDALKAMGMSDAFLGGNGSFPGLLSVASQDPARIGQVVHAARLTVDEEGTKASAATAVEVATESAMIPPENAFVMRCDRPYAMQIIHAVTGAVMFTAVVNDLEG